LIPEDHLARAIWEMTGQLDLSQYHGKFRGERRSGWRETNRSAIVVVVMAVCIHAKRKLSQRDRKVMQYHPGTGGCAD